MLHDLIMCFLFGGGAFYLFGWFWAEISINNKAKRRMARYTLLWPFWPVFFLSFVCVCIWKYFLMLIKMAEIGVGNGQDQKEGEENFKRK
jgi:hypothetical protein